MEDIVTNFVQYMLVLYVICRFGKCYLEHEGVVPGNILVCTNADERWSSL